MSEADAAARRLEARVGKRFVEVLRKFVAAEILRNPAKGSAEHGIDGGGPCRVARWATPGTSSLPSRTRFSSMKG